jgi:hypothetical protein
MCMFMFSEKLFIDPINLPDLNFIQIYVRFKFLPAVGSTRHVARWKCQCIKQVKLIMDKYLL